jgi:hypothetical protein
MGDVDETPPEVRIGDRERREVDARLQRAQADGVLTLTEYEERAGDCWKARTRRELDVLVRDLPPDAGAEPAPAPQTAVATPPPAAPQRRSGRRITFGTIAAVVLVGGVLWGGSRVVTAEDGSVVFGNRDVVVGATDDHVQVGALFGKLEVRVPADARVTLQGGMAFGNTKCYAACDGTGQRDVVVDSGGAFGNITVLRVGEQARDNDNDNNGRDDDDN